MITLQVEVGEGRQTAKKTGYMHQVTIKTEEGYQSVQTFNNTEIKPGKYSAKGQIRVAYGKDGFPLFKVDVDMRTLAELK